MVRRKNVKFVCGQMSHIQTYNIIIISNMVTMRKTDNTLGKFIVVGIRISSNNVGKEMAKSHDY